MYLIVGLGNPEPEYKWTRHNMGFETINKIAYDHNIDMSKSRYNANVGRGIIRGKKVVLLKPKTYMNNSGESVGAVANHLKIPLDQIIIIHDEIALDCGIVRIKYKGGTGGHNGIRSVAEHLRSGDFLRLRLGIGGRPKGVKLKKYVISHFLTEEHEAAIQGITLATAALEHILKDGYISAMNLYNKRTEQPKKQSEDNGDKIQKTNGDTCGT